MDLVYLNDHTVMAALIAPTIQMKNIVVRTRHNAFFFNTSPKVVVGGMISWHLNTILKVAVTFFITKATTQIEYGFPLVL